METLRFDECNSLYMHLTYARISLVCILPMETIVRITYVALIMYYDGVLLKGSQIVSGRVHNFIVIFQIYSSVLPHHYLLYKNIVY